jgi:hypothetical protein
MPLPAAQAGSGHEFNFHSHGCQRDGSGAAMWERYEDVDDGLGTTGGKPQKSP